MDEDLAAEGGNEFSDEFGWENISAAIEESRIASRKNSMDYEPATGESSHSYQAFLWMHREYEQTYHELLYKEWVNWHRELEREADRSIRRASRAASTFHRSWAIKWTRPRIRRRGARSEICVCTVDGFHHSDQTPRTTHFPANISVVRPASAAF